MLILVDVAARNGAERVDRHNRELEVSFTT